MARVHRRKRDRLQRGTGQAAGHGPEDWAKRPLADGEASEGVDEREAVGARVLGRAGDLGDVRDRGGKLGPERLPRG